MLMLVVDQFVEVYWQCEIYDVLIRFVILVNVAVLFCYFYLFIYLFFVCKHDPTGQPHAVCVRCSTLLIGCIVRLLRHLNGFHINVIIFKFILLISNKMLIICFVWPCSHRQQLRLFFIRFHAVLKIAVGGTNAIYGWHWINFHVISTAVSEWNFTKL